MFRKHYLKEFGHDTISLNKEPIEINMHSLKTNREEKLIKDNIYFFLLVLHFMLIECLYNQFPISPCVYKITFMNRVTRKFSLVFYILVCDKKNCICMQMIVFIIHFQFDFCVCSSSNITMCLMYMRFLLAVYVFINSKLIIYLLLLFLIIIICC